MSEREALLAAIRTAPDDDLPRLVYADWLEENGDSLPAAERHSAGDRAAFIRAQIESARAEPYSIPARSAAERAGKLLHSINRENWTQHLRGMVLDCEFERGFVGHAIVDVAQFPEVANTLFDSDPVRSLRAVRPGHLEYEVLLDPFFAAPRLTQLTALDLQNSELNYDDPEKLIACPHLTGLTHLSLRSNPLNPDWFRRFIEGDQFPNLTSLDVADNSHLGPAIAKAFRQASHRPFNRLNLNGIGFRSEDLKRALGGDCVSEVEELRLRWDAGDDRPGPLTQLELSWVIPWKQLRLLDLEGQGIGMTGVREIVSHDQARCLRWLNLARNYIGQSGVHLLTEESSLKLYYLDVRHNDLSAKDALALQKRFPEAQIVV
jgi:uncharacterized protein (TIGR02996 family)